MFFWKFTRSGKFSSRYISLIIDFHESQTDAKYLLTNFEECKDILLLIHDVETLNGENNNSAGLEKKPFQQQVELLGYSASSIYQQQRYNCNLVLGQMTLGTHDGIPLDYGISNKSGDVIYLNKNNLKISMRINAQTGLIYGNEDKLKAYRNNPLFINEGYYFDLMPMHSCIVEIVNKMLDFNRSATIDYLKNILKWREL